jgi:hypothetical protein
MLLPELFTIGCMVLSLGVREPRSRFLGAKPCFAAPRSQHGCGLAQRKQGDRAGEILPVVPPLKKEGTQEPPFVKPVLSFVEGGTARGAGGFRSAAVEQQTFASSIAGLAYPKPPVGRLAAY